MPHINRIRVNNVKYNFGTQYYDDFVLRFSGKNTIYDLANGGGKSVLMLLLLQNLIPNCTLDEKQPIEKLFRSGNGNTTIHSLIEWKLNPCHVKNGFQYMTTGFCARKARGGAGEDGTDTNDKTAVDYFNYCIFYRQFNDNDLKNLPLVNGKERITYLGLRSYLQELEKKDFHVQVKIFDRKGDYQRFIGEYGLFESEWEIIRGINKTEGHVRTYFETNYRTTRKVVEDLLIEEIIEKSFYRKTGTDQENDGMADTLLGLKDQLVLLSKKKNELHYYDRQAELLDDFAARIGSLKGMYYKKQGLEEQLVKTYNTTLSRRMQKEQAHEQLEGSVKRLEDEKQEALSMIALADIRKKELLLGELTEAAAAKKKELSDISGQLEKKRERIEERECDNHYLNYVEYEREYLAAKEAVSEILSGGEALEEDLFAMANELNKCAELEKAELAETIGELQEESALLEKKKAELSDSEKELLVKREVLEETLLRLERKKTKLREEMKLLSEEEGLLLFSDVRKELAQAEKEKRAAEKELAQTEEELSQTGLLSYGAEMQGRSMRKEEERLTAELTVLAAELKKYDRLREQIEQLIGIYGGTRESLENVLFRRQKELVIAQRENAERKQKLHEKLAALHDGLPVAEPAAVTVFLEELRRYYDEKAVSGYEYLKMKEDGERELLLERCPCLPYAAVTSADLSGIAADAAIRRKDGSDALIPVLSLAALEREKEIADENALIFLGASASEEKKLLAELSELEKVSAGQYERERVLKQDYDFARLYAKECADYEKNQQQYEERKGSWNRLQREIEEQSAKTRLLKEQETFLTEKSKELTETVASGGTRLENLRKLAELENALTETENESRQTDVLLIDVKNSLEGLCAELKSTAEELESVYYVLSGKRQELFRVLKSEEAFKGYVRDKEYVASGLSGKELEAAFAGKKAAYEQKNADVSDKQKLAVSCEKAMEQLRGQLQLLGHTVEELELKNKENGCARTEMEQMLVFKKEVFELQNMRLSSDRELKELEEKVHRMMGSIQHARQSAEEVYKTADCPELPAEKLETFVRQQKERRQAIEQAQSDGQKNLRSLEEQCYALKAMAQDMERMMRSAGIAPENVNGCLETGQSLKEQYESLRTEYEAIVLEEQERLEGFEKEKRLLLETLKKLGAHELAAEIDQSLNAPENEDRIREELASLKSVTDCLMLEKERIGKDMDSLQELKDRFEAQCLQSCLNIREELERLTKLSKISMDGQMISMITLQIPYIKEEMFKDAMSEYIDRIILKVEELDSQAERLSFIRSRLAFKHLFAVIVSNMDAIRMTLYKRERMKEQSRYLKYEEAVGSTGQSQGIYIQFLVAIINYISSINSGNADPLELKKVIFIDNPFGAAKDIYIWEPIFKLLKANNVQLIVPARGATPAITGHFEVNYILGQKLIDGRQQTVVVDYRSQTEESGLEYATLTYEQETLTFS